METGRNTGYRNGVHKTKTNFQTTALYADLSFCQPNSNSTLADIHALNI
jgi:hypothetical protein